MTRSSTLPISALLVLCAALAGTSAVNAQDLRAIPGMAAEVPSMPPAGVPAAPAVTPRMLEWVGASQQVCSAACAGAGLAPVVTGHRQDKPYFVCRANVEGTGMRAGYNVEPDWSKACWAGWGGKEVTSATYDCLCTGKAVVQTP